MVSLDTTEFQSSTLRSPRARAARRAEPRTFCFSIQAAAEPGVMPRVLGLFAKRSLVPSRWVSGVHGRGELAIDLQVEGLTPELTAYMARCLTQIADVRTVLTSEKGSA